MNPQFTITGSLKHQYTRADADSANFGIWALGKTSHLQVGANFQWGEKTKKILIINLITSLMSLPLIIILSQV